MTTDSDSFDTFYRSTAHRISRFAFAMTGDPAEAQDITQEAYVRAWRNWSRIGRFEHPESWVRLIVTRLATDRWRRLRLRRRVESNEQQPGLVEAPSDNTVLLVNALRRLPADQRRVLCLHYLLDQPIADIAAETGMPLGTVKSHLSRGRTALANVLGVTVKERNGVR